VRQYPRSWVMQDQMTPACRERKNDRDRSKKLKIKELPLFPLIPELQKCSLTSTNQLSNWLRSTSLKRIDMCTLHLQITSKFSLAWLDLWIAELRASLQTRPSIHKVLWSLNKLQFMFRKCRSPWENSNLFLMPRVKK
jgi:hypothetical protein